MPAGVAKAIDEFVARVPGHSCALALDGPAGIGKTHHLAAVVELAIRRGWRVLQLQPNEAAGRIGAAGLIDLFGQVTNDEIAALLPLHRRALESALQRSSVDDGPAPDAQVVAAALTSLLSQFAADGPVLLVVDDVQWLDPTTAMVLGFVARHLPDRNLGFAIALRTPAAEQPLLAELESMWAVRRVEVPPLEEDEIAALVRSRVDFQIPQSVLSRAVTASGGNPLYGTELARIWADGTDALPESLAVPQTLQSLVGSRLSALPDRSQLALATASAIGRASIGELRALELDEALAPAERAGVINVRNGMVQFSHPLLAAAAYNGLTSADRAQLHLRVADVVADADHRARHLALGADGADEKIAVLLDEVSGRAEHRLDINAALDAARLALQMTPAESPVPERRFTLARLLHQLGDVRAAQAELEGLVGVEVPRRTRVRALILLCELTYATVSFEAAAAHGQAAVDVATPGEDDDLLADAHLYLAQTLNASSDIRAHADQALTLIAAGARPNPASHAYAVSLLAALDFYAGGRFDAARYEEALAIEEAGGVLAEQSMMGHAVSVFGHADEIAAGLELVDRWEKRCAEEGCESQGHYILVWRSYFLLNSGRLDEAEAVIKENIAVGERLGLTFNLHFARANVARLALQRGQLGTAREIVEPLVQIAVDIGAVQLELVVRRIAAEAALCDGDWAAAVQHLRRVEEGRDKGRNEMYSSGHQALLVEALAALGQIDEAEEVLTGFEEIVRTFDSARGRALAARARGHVAAARSDEAGAIDSLDAAIVLFDEQATFPLDRARTLVTKGQVLRRLRRKARAKETFVEARSAFAAMGADGWVERVDDELARIGLRRPAPNGLTSTELQIIDLVASGRSAKEVAAALYVSSRTVEGHLVRIYRKIGVRSRVELVAKYATGGVRTDTTVDLEQ